MAHPALTEHAAYRHAKYAVSSPGWAGRDDADLMVRVSSGGQADLCFGRLHHRGDPAHMEVKSEAMVFGTVQHRLVEAQVANPDLTVGPALVVETMGQVGVEEGLDLPALLGEALTPWVADQVNLAAAWRRWARINLNYPEGLGGAITEGAIIHPLCPTVDGGHTVWLAGTPDLLLPAEGRGLDWKTANRGWPASRAASQNQQYAYAWLARQVWGVDLTRWTFVVANRAKGEWEGFEVPVTQHGIDGFLTRMVATVRCLELGAVVYHPKSGQSGKRGWWCSPLYCGAWSVCPARFLGDGMDSVPADRSAGWPAPFTEEG